ncbi:hypothetical protein Lal_00041085 [Lupinus albus]|nr:hypothetical protein Lal_00041085 [Lupinus albus]
MNDVYVKCNEMMNAFAQLLPTAFSTTNYEAPPTQTFDMPVAHEFQQQYESQTQTQTHHHAYSQTPAPQQQQQQPFHYEDFGGTGDYSIHHQFGSSSQYQGTLPPYNAFGTTSTTPLSAFQSQQYYQPTMPSQGNFFGDEDDEDDDDEDEEEEDEEVPQLVRGGSGQPRQRQQQ